MEEWHASKWDPLHHGKMHGRLGEGPLSVDYDHWWRNDWAVKSLSLADNERTVIDAGKCDGEGRCMIARGGAPFDVICPVGEGRSKGWVPFAGEHGHQINPWPPMFWPPAIHWAKRCFAMRKTMEATLVPLIATWLVFGHQYLFNSLCMFPNKKIWAIDLSLCSIWIRWLRLDVTQWRTASRWWRREVWKECVARLINLENMATRPVDTRRWWSRARGLRPMTTLPPNLVLRPNERPFAKLRASARICLMPLASLWVGLELGHWWRDSRLPNETKGVWAELQRLVKVPGC